jgi:prepilin-type processing-associated H-X9-DG protein
VGQADARRLFAGERQRVPQYRPTRKVPPTTTVRRVTSPGLNEEPSLYHPGGVNALFGDGSVHFIEDSVDLVGFRSILTIAGSETVSFDDY